MTDPIIAATTNFHIMHSIYVNLLSLLGHQFQYNPIENEINFHNTVLSKISIFYHILMYTYDNFKIDE